ncbi:PREDICTED: uncharacterized protein LOC109115685 [Nelumbo nucifera]|uniref:Uncharacterized protein LOC109115685 n=1 Tax=Nelumbo nucifera TaxID=4432 RepID=A0A1U8Q9H8_NELNU|nr:PREDICTED: uncharacterized protein LOC109115685 [Nelumbo nucifera]
MLLELATQVDEEPLTPEEDEEDDDEFRVTARKEIKRATAMKRSRAAMMNSLIDLQTIGLSSINGVSILHFLLSSWIGFFLVSVMPSRLSSSCSSSLTEFIPVEVVSSDHINEPPDKSLLLLVSGSYFLLPACLGCFSVLLFRSVFFFDEVLKVVKENKDIKSQITKLTNALTIQERGKIPSQPQTNLKGSHMVQESTSDLENTKGSTPSLLPMVRYSIVIDSESTIPLILGWPFLATTNALINWRNGLMKLSFGNLTLEVNIFHVGKQPRDEDKCYHTYMIDSLIAEEVDERENSKSLEYLLSNWSAQDKRKFLVEVRKFYWDDPYLFKYCPNQIMRRCIPDGETCGGHFSMKKTTAKVLQSGLCWPTLFKDINAFCRSCDRCQKLGTLTRRHMMPLNLILVIKIFYCWGIDFMGSFSPSFVYLYIPLAVNHVSKWVEVVSCRTNDNKVVVKFLKENVLSRYGTPHVIISDQGAHFCNRSFESLMHRYGVIHKVSTAYHP